MLTVLNLSVFWSPVLHGFDPRMFSLPLTAEKKNVCIRGNQCLLWNLNLENPKNETYKLKEFYLLSILASSNECSVHLSVNRFCKKKIPVIIAMVAFTKSLSSGEVEKLQWSWAILSCHELLLVKFYRSMYIRASQILMKKNHHIHKLGIVSFVQRAK